MTQGILVGSHVVGVTWQRDRPITA